REGRAVAYGTSPVVWCEPGTNAQHAYFQMLHQGTDVVPVEFILVQRDEEAEPVLAAPLARQHRMLLVNGQAQAQALMQGRASTEPAPDLSRHRPGTTPVPRRA